MHLKTDNEQIYGPEVNSENIVYDGRSPSTPSRLREKKSGQM